MYSWSLIGPALCGAVFLGISCGLLGCFLVVRRLSLLGDALSHSVLPGIAAGFLISAGRNTPVMLLGALIAGLLSVWGVSLLRYTTRLKEDTLLGLVLTGFYATGAVLFTWIQNLPLSGKGGLNSFLFGQAASISPNDLWWLGALTLCTILFIVLLYKELLITSFDPIYAEVNGFRPAWIHPLLMTFVTIAVIIALEKVGVVLVSALLIIPPVTARLHTHHFRTLLFLSALFTTISAITGVLLSASAPRLALGPLIVLSSAAILLLSILLSRRYGVLSRIWRHHRRRLRILRENTLKSVYQVAEAEGQEQKTCPDLSIQQIALRTNQDILQTQKALNRLVSPGWLIWNKPQQSDVRSRLFNLTTTGWQEAARITRNHRLWELYLTNKAAFPADHVHDSAERMEHELPEEVVTRLLELLKDPESDPHGRPIPPAKRT
jgi:manganese/zinc/iron transport system permease protein